MCDDSDGEAIDVAVSDTREEMREEFAEELAAMMLRQSIATGHGDTHEELLKTLEEAIADLRRERIAYREAATKLLEAWPWMSQDISEALEKLRALTAPPPGPETSAAP